MEIDTEQLAKTYAELSDEELLSMHAARELTEEAYDVLEKELTHRGIPILGHKVTDEVVVEMPTSWGSKNFKLIVWSYFLLWVFDKLNVVEFSCPSWLSGLLSGQLRFLWSVGITCLVLAIAGGAARQLFDYLNRSADRIFAVEKNGQTKESLVGHVPPAFWYQYPYSKAIRILSWFLVAVLSAAFGLLVGAAVYPPQNGIITSEIVSTILLVSYGRFLISWGLIRILAFRLERLNRT